MGAAFQRRLVEAGLDQHRLRQFDMGRFTGMRGAGQGQFSVAEAVGISSTCFDQRQRLDCLDCGAREHRARRIADLQDGLAVGVEDRDGAAMGALDDRTAQNLDQNRICHGSPVKYGPLLSDPIED